MPQNRGGEETMPRNACCAISLHFWAVELNLYFYLLPEKSRKIEPFVTEIQYIIQCRKSKIKLNLAITCYKKSFFHFFQCIYEKYGIK